MDASEATKIVMSRIQSLDPENASKTMGYILIQEQGEKEMIRLAFSPDALLLSYINQAKARFALNHFRSNSPRIIIPNNNGGFNLTGPPSPFQRSRARPVNNGSGSPFYGGNDFSGEEFLGGGVNYQPQEELPFFDEPPGTVEPIMSPSGRSDSMVFPYGEDVNRPHPFHRRSCSVNDAAFLANLEEGGGGNGNGFLWRPCMYYARGFCKNGSSCKFLHGDNGGGEAVDGGSPSGVAGFDDLMKMKAFQQQQQQRLAFMGHNPFAYNKNMDENLRNLPEVRSIHEVLGIPTVSARFGTAPFFWNWGMVAMTYLLPAETLRDRSKVQQLVDLFDPLVRAVDGIAGERVSMRVDLDCSDGKSRIGIFSHRKLSESVGMSTAAFVLAILEGSTQPGVWFPEEPEGIAVEARETLLSRAAQGTINFIMNKAPWMVETDPKELGFGIYN